MRYTLPIFAVRRDERRPLALLFVYYFFYGATLTMAKAARDAYFLSRFDVSFLPLMFLPAACAVALTAPVYNTITKRFGVLQTSVLSGFFFALTLVLIQLHLQGWMIPVLYIWTDVITTVIYVQFWVFAGSVFNSRQASRWQAL